MANTRYDELQTATTDGTSPRRLGPLPVLNSVRVSLASIDGCDSTTARVQ